MSECIEEGELRMKIEDLDRLYSNLDEMNSELQDDYNILDKECEELKDEINKLNLENESLIEHLLNE